jgi:hypothetical protein
VDRWELSPTVTFLVHRDLRATIGRCRGDEVVRSPTNQTTVHEGSFGGKTELFSRITQLDWLQRFVDESKGGNTILDMEDKSDLITQSRDGSPSLDPKIVLNVPIHDQVRRETHLWCTVVAEGSEQRTGIKGPALGVSDFPHSLHDLVPAQQVQELDGIEEVRLANTVDSRQAGKRSEANVDVEEILEALDSKTG